MAKTGINYNPVTGEIKNIVTVSVGSDLILNKADGMELLEIVPGHKLIGKEEEYEIKNGKPKKKAAVNIAKEKKDRASRKQIIN